MMYVLSKHLHQILSVVVGAASQVYEEDLARTHPLCKYH